VACARPSLLQATLYILVTLLAWVLDRCVRAEEAAIAAQFGAAYAAYRAQVRRWL